MSLTKITSDGIADGSIVNADLHSAANIAKSKLASLDIVNADINASAAIAGSKISPNFGSQNVTTTGTLGSGNITISNDAPSLFFTEGDANPDYQLLTNGGNFRIYDVTNTTNRIVVNTDGHVDITGNLDVGAGIDVTGNMTVTGTVDGRDVAADGTKLDGIEASATADQTASEILTLIKTVDGSGSGLDADLLDGYTSGQFLRSDTSHTASGDITFSGGAGAATIGANSDIRFTNGTWTGNAYAKIQQHGNSLYIAGGSSSLYSLIFRYNDQDKVYFKSNGTIWPQADSTSDLGLNDKRWANVYADTFYGDGSNLTGINSTTNLSTSTSTTAVTIASSSGNNATISEASGSAAGVMSVAHHDKLDGIESSATADQSASEILTLIKTVDGSGSGLDADLLDGLTSSEFVRSNAADTIQDQISMSKDTTDVLNFTANSTNTSRGISFNSRSALGAHHNDGWLRLNADNEFTNGVYTPGKIRADNGLYFAGSRYLDDPTGQYGTVQVNGTGVNNWEGYSIDGRAVFMHDGGTATGIYNDVNNHWILYAQHNSYVQLRHAGNTKLQTNSGGVGITGTCSATTFSGSGASLSNVSVHSARSASSNGYVRYNDGTQIAYGNVNLSNGGWTTKSFATSFPSACRAVVTVPNDSTATASAQRNHQVRNVGTSSFQGHSGQHTNPCNHFYIAIGY